MCEAQLDHTHTRSLSKSRKNRAFENQVPRPCIHSFPERHIHGFGQSLADTEYAMAAPGPRCTAGARRAHPQVHMPPRMRCRNGRCRHGLHLGPGRRRRPGLVAYLPSWSPILLEASPALDRLVGLPASSLAKLTAARLVHPSWRAPRSRAGSSLGLSRPQLNAILILDSKQPYGRASRVGVNVHLDLGSQVAAAWPGAVVAALVCASHARPERLHRYYASATRKGTGHLQMECTELSSVNRDAPAQPRRSCRGRNLASA
jgi:hypothetical protein